MTKTSLSSLAVLVVDDESLIRWSVAETLSLSGHRVIQAGTGEAALKAIATAREPIDVVLLDYRLPDSADLRLLSRIRQLSPRSAVLMMTGYDTSELAEAATVLGAYRVLRKPFDLQDLDSLVLEAHASRRQ